MAQGKRGMELENMVEQANEMYKKKGVALIDKIPTPWSVQYNKKTKRVYKAYPLQKSTVDFIGLSHGKSIAFDAKTTKNRTNFPLSNIYEHQIEYLVKHQDQGGESFIIVWFQNRVRTFYLPIDELVEWWENSKKGGRKSIPFEWFRVNTDLILTGNGIALHYLRNVDKRRGKNGEKQHIQYPKTSKKT